MKGLDAAAACSRPDLRAMMARYEFGAVDHDERATVDAHLLSCDVCVAELERGTTVVDAMRADGPRFRRVLAGVSPRVRTARRRPARVVWLLAAAVLVVVGIGVTRHWTNETRWATFPR